MKARTDCTKCRVEIYKKAREEYERCNYTAFKNQARSFASWSTAAVLMAMVRRGRSPEYIRKLFDELVMIYDTPTLFDKPISMDDMIQQLEDEYGVDFGRINVHIESEEEYIRGLRK